MTVAGHLEDVLGKADIISAATLSNEPLIKGALVKPGAHVDLVGAFKPSMRESDDDLVQRADLYVDTRDGCLVEGGDVVQPLQAGVITPEDIKADLYDLCRGTHPGRQSDDAVTFFNRWERRWKTLRAPCSPMRRRANRFIQVQRW